MRDFLAYEDVRMSGQTNMFNISTVIKLSDNILDKEKCLAIMKGYSKYADKWLKS